jgi:hypothetical protein
MKTVRKKKKVFTAILSIAAMFTTPAIINAQGVEVSAGGDIVSSYIWRGTDCGGVSVQPGLTVSVGGLSLTAWGSVGFDNADTKEFDFTLGYGVGGLSVAITDYWFNTDKYFNYAAHNTAHMYEGTIGYDFGPLALSWNTFFTGSDYKENGDRAYSSYVEVSAPFSIKDVEFAAEVGATPWEGLYSTGFNVVNIGLKAAKTIKVTDSFSVPLFTKIIFNPNSEGAYFVLGASF